MKTIDEMIAVMQGFKDGKEVQYLGNTGEWKPANVPCWSWAVCDYRLTPEPETRLKRLDEIPFPCLVRFSGNDDEVLVVDYCKASNQLMLANGAFCNIPALAESGATYSTDTLRKTWLPFTVEVEE